MKDDTMTIPFHQPDSVSDLLTEIAREGARRMLAEALKAQADAFVASCVNRHPIVTPYRRPKLTPLELSWPGAA